MDELRVVVNTDGLFENHRKLTLVAYLRSLIRYRNFIWADAKSRAFRATEGFYLWQVWLVLSPLLEAGMYGFLFGFVFHASDSVNNFPTYLLSGMAIFTLVSRLTAAGSGAVQRGLRIIRAFKFPAAAVIASQGLKVVLDSLPSLFFSFGIALFFQVREGQFYYQAALVIPVVLLSVLFGLGFMTIVATCTAMVPDLKAVVNLMLRAWMFFSCIFYPISRLDDVPWLRTLAEINPAYCFISAARNLMMEGQIPSAVEISILLAWSLGAVIVGLIGLWLCERRFNEFT